MTYEDIAELFEYDTSTGELSWKIKPSVAVNIGDTAGSPNGQGYIQIQFKGKMYQAHRIVMAKFGLLTGEVVDHINHNKSDNRLCNLRMVSHLENTRHLKKTPVSGHFGIKMNGTKFGVRVNSLWLGSYQNLDTALAVRNMALAI